MDRKKKDDQTTVFPDEKDTQKYKLIKNELSDADISKDDTVETPQKKQETTDGGSTTITRAPIKFNKKRISKSKTGDFLLKKSAPLPEYLVPYLKNAFLLNINEGIHVYDENYRLIGSIMNPTRRSDTGDEKTTEFYKDDLLPNRLRSRCQKTVGGYQIKMGSLLYILNAKYQIKDKINLTYAEIEKFKDIQLNEKTIPHLRIHDEEKKTLTRVKERKKDIKKASKLPAKEIVDVSIEKFKYAIKLNNIQGDYYIQEKLGKKNLQALNCLYNGDLSQLNEDTRNIKSRELITNLDGGLSMLKAGLIHELYINTTLEGRGGKEGTDMNKFLTYIIAIKEDGSLGGIHQILSSAEQKKMINLFGDSAANYPDRSEVIRDVYHKIVSDYKKMEREEEMKDIGNEKFKAFLIRKLYLYTNRTDRGNGVTMICLTRDIIDFSIKK